MSDDSVQLGKRARVVEDDSVIVCDEKKAESEPINLPSVEQMEKQYLRPFIRKVKIIKLMKTTDQFYINKDTREEINQMANDYEALINRKIIASRYGYTEEEEKDAKYKMIEECDVANYKRIIHTDKLILDELKQLISVREGIIKKREEQLRRWILSFSNN